MGVMQERSFIQSRLVPSAAVLAAILLICAGMAMVVYNERAYGEAKLQQVQAEAAILASTVAAALTFNDAKAAQD